MQIIALDGRTLGYELLGPHDGDRVVSLHGTPGSRIGRFPIGDPGHLGTMDPDQIARQFRWLAGR